MKKNFGEIYLVQSPLMSRPDSRSDPNGGSEPNLGRETIYWDSLLDFFFKVELVPVGMTHIL